MMMIGGWYGNRADAAIESRVPQIVYVPAVCGGPPARLDITNRSKHVYVNIGFNDDVPSDVEPGGSINYEITSGSVQVMLAGQPYGPSYLYEPASCNKLP